MNKDKLFIDAVIFDLDGTLLDTLKDLADCYNRVLQQQGFPTHPENSYKNFIGDGATKCVERALPEDARDESTIQQCMTLQKQDYQNNWRNCTQPFDGIENLLDALVNLKIRMAVLSNKDQSFTELCINHFFPEIHFDLIQGNQQGLPLKPDPAGCNRIAGGMSVSTKNCLLLGDSAMDMQAARSAGMLGIGALWGYRSNKELVGAGAFSTIAAPLDLLSFLGKP